MITFQITGLDSWNRRMRRAPAKINRNTYDAMRKAGSVAVASIRSEIRGRRTWAKRRGRPVTARRGRLGIDTGRGKRSVRQSRIVKQGNVYVVRVGSSVDYMNIHEARGQYRWLAPGMRKANRYMRRVFGARHIFRGV